MGDSEIFSAAVERIVSNVARKNKGAIKAVMFHITATNVAAKMLDAKHKHLAPAVLAAIEYTLKKQVPAVISVERLKEFLGVKTALFSEPGSSDLVIIAPTDSQLSSVLSKTLRIVESELDLDVLTLKLENNTRTILGTKETLSPLMGHLNSRLKGIMASKQGSTIATKVNEAVADLEGSVKYSAKISKYSSVSTLEGEFLLTYEVPEDSTVTLEALEKTERRPLADTFFGKRLKGSLPLERQLDRIIHAALYGTTYSYSYTASTSGTAFSKAKTTRKVKNIKVPLPKLRSGRGQSSAIDVISLTALINTKLPSQLEHDMQRPHLRNKSGRFAESVEIDRITQGRSGALTLYYTYMKYPYQTFEPGYKQGHKGYDPRTLINKSIRNIAVDMITERFRSVRL